MGQGQALRVPPDCYCLRGTLTQAGRNAIGTAGEIVGAGWKRSPMNVCRSFFAVAFLFTSATLALAQEPTYSVAGLALGEKVHFDSKTYRQYQCSPSQQFEGITWCQARIAEQDNRGYFTAQYSILHSRDGTLVYINRFEEPVYWNDKEINDKIGRLAAKIGEQPRVIKGPSRSGLPDTTIAIWGKVILEPLDNESRKAIAAGRSVKRGILIDTIGDYTRSAREQLPMYRLTGGAGFVWVASNKDRRGTLRSLAIDPSAFYDSISQPSSTAPPQQSNTPNIANYARIGFWTIRHRTIEQLSLCSAAVTFEDHTSIELALIQSDSANTSWSIFISNPGWKDWISTKREHALRFATAKNWQRTFTSIGSNTLGTGDLSKDVMNSIADATSIEVFNEDKTLLTSIDMKDSAAALRAVVKCVRDHPYVPVQTSETVLSGAKFFLAPDIWRTSNPVVKTCIAAIQGPHLPGPSGCVSFAEKEQKLSTDRFKLSDEFPSTRLILPGQVPVRLLKVMPNTGEQALHSYAKDCSAQTDSNGKPLDCNPSSVWIFQSR
jgi:hypothetical protein